MFYIVARKMASSKYNLIKTSYVEILYSSKFCAEKGCDREV